MSLFCFCLFVSLSIFVALILSACPHSLISCTLATYFWDYCLDKHSEPLCFQGSTTVMHSSFTTATLSWPGYDKYRIHMYHRLLVPLKSTIDFNPLLMTLQQFVAELLSPRWTAELLIVPPPIKNFLVPDFKQKVSVPVLVWFGTNIPTCQMNWVCETLWEAPKIILF